MAPRSFLAVIRLLGLVLIAAAELAGCGDNGTGVDDGTQASPAAYLDSQCGAVTHPGCVAYELAEYLECVNDDCDSTYRECFGPNYQSAIYAGPCKTVLECVTACGCSDPDCSQACPGHLECSECMLARPCGMSCEGTCGTGRGACDALERCCDMMAVGAEACRNGVSAMRTNPNREQADTSCRQFYELYGCE